MLTNYLKIALKVLARRKFFTFISLFGISVTLVVLLIATALLDNVFGSQAPELKQPRTVGIYYARLEGKNSRRTGFPGYGLLDRYARNLPGVEKASFVSVPSRRVSYVDGKKIQSFLKHTDGAFWQIMDFQFTEGEPYSEADNQDGRFVAVINETTRKRFFGDQKAIGKTIQVGEQRFRVVGVVKDVSILRLLPFADVWVPTGTMPSSAYRREEVGDFMGILLAKSRADLPRIRTEFESRLARAEPSDPKQFDTITSSTDTLFSWISRTLFSSDLKADHAGRLVGLLLGLMVLFMLLPSINLVNINLSRILERASEIGVRRAFGAPKLSLIGQFLVENVVLTLVGGAIGLGMSAAVLAAINSSGVIPYAELHLNFRIFGYGLLIAIFFGVLSGAYPAWRMSRLHPVQALRGRS